MNKLLITSKIKIITAIYRYIMKTLTSLVESVDTTFNIGASTTPATLSVTGVGLIVVQTSAEIACALSFVNKNLHKITINKYNKKQKQKEND